MDPKVIFLLFQLLHLPTAALETVKKESPGPINLNLVRIRSKKYFFHLQPPYVIHQSIQFNDKFVYFSIWRTTVTVTVQSSIRRPLEGHLAILWPCRRAGAPRGRKLHPTTHQSHRSHRSSSSSSSSLSSTTLIWCTEALKPRTRFSIAIIAIIAIIPIIVIIPIV